MTNEISLSRSTAKFLAIAAALFGIALGLDGTFVFVISKCSQVFESFGSELPLPTKLLGGFPYLLWTPLVLSLVLWLLLRSDRARMLGYSILLFCEIVISMYIPIVHCSRVVE